MKKYIVSQAHHKKSLKKKQIKKQTKKYPVIRKNFKKSGKKAVHYRHSSQKSKTKPKLQSGKKLYSKYKKYAKGIAVQSKQDKNKLSYICQTCSYMTPSILKLRKHKEVHMKKKQLVNCLICSYKAIHRVYMEMHMIGEHTQENFQRCSHCGYKALYISALKTHMITHTGLKPFSCSLCSYRSRRKSHLKTHMKTHAKELPNTNSKKDKHSRARESATHKKKHTSNHPPQKSTQHIDSNEDGNQIEEKLLFQKIKSSKYPRVFLERLRVPSIHDAGQLPKKTIDFDQGQQPPDITKAKTEDAVRHTKRVRRPTDRSIGRHTTKVVERLPTTDRSIGRHTTKIVERPPTTDRSIGRHTTKIVERPPTTDSSIGRHTTKKVERPPTTDRSIGRHTTKIVERLPTKTVERLPTKTVERLPTKTVEKIPTEIVERLPSKRIRRLPAKLLESLPIMPVGRRTSNPVKRPTNLVTKLALKAGERPVRAVRKPAKAIRKLPAKAGRNPPAKAIRNPPAKAIRNHPTKAVGITANPKERYIEVTNLSYRDKQKFPLLKYLKKYKCTECSYSTVHQSTAKRHVMSRHSGERPFCCNLCEYRTISSFNLKKHQVVHVEKENFVCNICFYKTTREYLYTKHLRCQHAREKKKLPSTKVALQISEIKPSCKSRRRNKKLSKQASDLQISKVYSIQPQNSILSKAQVKLIDMKSIPNFTPFLQGRKNFNKVSKKSIKQKDSEAAPKTGTRNKQCPNCRYKSAHVSTLKRHIMRHTGEKPHKCEFCPYRTVSSFNLKQHIHVHFRQQRFSCTLCPYKARQMVSYRNHMLKMHHVEKAKTSPTLQNKCITPLGQVRLEECFYHGSVNVEVCIEESEQTFPCNNEVTLNNEVNSFENLPIKQEQFIKVEVEEEFLDDPNDYSFLDRDPLGLDGLAYSPPSTSDDIILQDGPETWAPR